MLRSNITDLVLILDFCNTTYDGYLCWPPTLAGRAAEQNCPAARLSDTSRHAIRHCGSNGRWMGKELNETSVNGWTNFTDCFPKLAQSLLQKIYENEPEAKMKFEIAHHARILEIVGFTCSFFALAISLFIFSHYRSLRNYRTRIHKNLFCAMLVQVVIRLVIYINQAMAQTPHDNYLNRVNTIIMTGIENTPFFCKAAYILLEYATTVMFVWMFIEGLYLYNMATRQALRQNLSFAMFYFAGWVLPVFQTAIWASATSAFYAKETNTQTCWYGYNFINVYWIQQGPRLAIILINLFFLLNVIHEIVIKLRQTNDNEVVKLRKTVRAAFVLLPLLGITNGLNVIEVSLDGTMWKFAFWTYCTHILRSFQGLIIPLFYCFLNGEVRLAFKKSYTDFVSMRSCDCPPPRSRCFQPPGPEELAEMEAENSANTGCCFSFKKLFCCGKVANNDAGAVAMQNVAVRPIVYAPAPYMYGEPRVVFAKTI